MVNSRAVVEAEVRSRPRAACFSSDMMMKLFLDDFKTARLVKAKKSSEVKRSDKNEGGFAGKELFSQHTKIQERREKRNKETTEKSGSKKEDH